MGAFTLRLSDKEDVNLEKIKKKCGYKTYSDAIRHIINTYTDLQNRLDSEMAENRQLRSDLSNIRLAVGEFNRAFNDMMSYKDFKSAADKIIYKPK